MREGYLQLLKRKIKKLKYYFDIMYKYQLYQNRNGYFQ